MNKSDFFYDLPQELIAQTPLKDRSSSRLLVLNKETGELSHKIFKDIKNYLKNNLETMKKLLYIILIYCIKKKKVKC